MPVFSRPFALALLTVPLGAAELVVRDVGVDLAVLPTQFSFESEAPTYRSSGDDSFKSGTGLSLGGRWSWARPGDSLGAVFSGDIGTNSWTYGSSGNYLMSYGGRAGISLGWAVADRWTLLAGPGVAYRLNRLALDSTAARPAFSTTGRSTGYDLRLETMWQASDSFLIRAYVGYDTQTHKEDEVDGVTTTLTTKGMTVGIGFAWRLSNAPETLR